MNLVHKLIYLLFFCLLAAEVFPQGQSYLFKNGNIKDSSLARSIYNISTFTPSEIKKDDYKIRMDSIIATSIKGGILKNTFMYNQSENLSEWIIQDYINNSWENGFRNKYFYDYNDNLTRWLEFYWNNYKWDSLSLLIYSYNTNGNLFQTIYQRYSDSGWQNMFRSTYEHYDLNGNCDTVIQETWANNQWQNNELVHSFYSYQNRKDSIYFYIWNGSGWQYDMKTNFYYNNSSTSPDSMLATYWGGGDLWMNYYKSIDINDSNNNIIEQTDQTWQAFYWRNAIKRFFTYNDLHFITSAYCKLWDGSKWIDADGDIVISNPDGFIVGFITNKINIYYSAFTNIDDRNEPKEFNYELSQNYPNPFNPSTTINYYIPATCFVTLKVYNILGEEITSLVNEEKSPGNHQIQFNAAGLASGIYIYRINAGAFTKSKLMILEK